VTEMRPDPDSDLAGEESEYGDDTGFAAEATRMAAAGSADDPNGTDNLEVNTAEDSAGLTADDDIGDGAD
jgi:hypothetical protein